MSDHDAHLMVIIQGQRDEFDDVDRVPETAQSIAAKYGQGMVDKLESLGWKFTIGREKKRRASLRSDAPKRRLRSTVG